MDFIHIIASYTNTMGISHFKMVWESFVLWPVLFR